MRLSRALLIALIMISSGCGPKKQQTGPGPGQVGNPPGQRLIVTHDLSLVGKVATVNVPGQFVVLNFPPGHLPAPQQQLTLYHLGIKAGVVKVTSHQLSDNVVADIVSGDAQVGDEVREK